MKTDHKHTFENSWDIAGKYYDKNNKNKVELYEDRRCTDQDCRVREVRRRVVFVYK